MGRAVWVAMLVTGVLLVACDASTLAATCTRSDQGTACREASTAERTATGWRVELRTTVRNQVEYRDGGNLCAYTSTRCVQEECVFHLQGENTWSSQRAIDECRSRFGR